MVGLDAFYISVFYEGDFKWPFYSEIYQAYPYELLFRFWHCASIHIVPDQIFFMTGKEYLDNTLGVIL